MKLTQLIFLIGLFLIENESTNAQQNLVTTNPGFELGDGTGWDFLEMGGSDVDFTFSNQNPQEGTYCLEANVTTLGSDAWSIQLKKNGWAVTEGVSYLVTIWAKSEKNGSKINFTIGKYTADYNEYKASYGIALTTEWKKYSLQLESPVTTTNDITLALHISSLDKYWIDNFKVIELNNEVVGASTSTNGKSIDVTFHDALINPDNEIQLPFFVYNQFNEQKGVRSVTQSTSANILVLALDVPIYKTETITLDYFPGTLSTELGKEISAFSIDVENNSTLTVASVSDNNIKGITVHPNPANEYIVFENEACSISSAYQLIDLSGKIVQTGTVKSVKYARLDISSLQKGFYILRITTTNQISFIAKFLKN